MLSTCFLFHFTFIVSSLFFSSGTAKPEANFHICRQQWFFIFSSSASLTVCINLMNCTQPQALRLLDFFTVVHLDKGLPDISQELHIRFTLDMQHHRCVFLCVIGLIHVGDELREVNGIPVDDKKPEEIIRILVSLIPLSLCVSVCVCRPSCVCCQNISPMFQLHSLGKNNLPCLWWQKPPFTHPATYDSHPCDHLNTGLSLEVFTGLYTAWIPLDRVRCYVILSSRLRRRPPMSSVTGLDYHLLCVTFPGAGALWDSHLPQLTASALSFPIFRPSHRGP